MAARKKQQKKGVKKPQSLRPRKRIEERSEAKESGPRALWSGYLTLGLISVPVKMYSAARERPIRFRMLDKNDLCPISFASVCREDNKPVKREDIVWGYEYEKGKYVVLDNDDLSRLRPRQSRVIDIAHFTELSAIPTERFDKAYYLVPHGSGGRAYSLINDALKRSEKVAIARFTFRNRERFGAISSTGAALLLQELRYTDEMLPVPAQIPKEYYSAEELELALALIESLTEPFVPDRFEDMHERELRALIESKLRDQLPPPSPEALPAPTEPENIVEALRRSISQNVSTRQ
jgi:DNA end-binding protein Ku